MWYSSCNPHGRTCGDRPGQNPAHLNGTLLSPFPFPIFSLTQSPEVRCWNENTVVAALVEWGAGPVGHAASPEQRRQLAGCVRLQHCTHSYLAYVIPQVSTCVCACVSG